MRTIRCLIQPHVPGTVQLSILLPQSDGIADCVRTRLLNAEVVTYESHSARELADVTFYCLPYMAGGEALELIAALPRLRILQSLSSGVDDLTEILPAGVGLCNGRGLHHEEGTAELAIALALVGLRQLRLFADYQRMRQWNHLRTDTLEGKRVTIVGYGAMGRAIEQRLIPFECRIRRVSRTARDGVSGLDQLPTIAAQTDVLIVCIALSSQTTALVNARVLAALPDGALIVNVARGRVVDAEALLTEVAGGRLSAALDVTQPEPLPRYRQEWELPNLFLTPHIGGDTFEFARRAGEFVADQVSAHITGGSLLNVVR